MVLLKLIDIIIYFVLTVLISWQMGGKIGLAFVKLRHHENIKIYDIFIISKKAFLIVIMYIFQILLFEKFSINRFITLVLLLIYYIIVSIKCYEYKKSININNQVK